MATVEATAVVVDGLTDSGWVGVAAAATAVVVDGLTDSGWVVVAAAAPADVWAEEDDERVSGLIEV